VETAPCDRIKALTDAPVFDKDNRPKEKKRGVDDGIGISQVVGHEADDGDYDERMSVGSKKGKVESDGLSKLKELRGCRVVGEEARTWPRMKSSCS